MTTSSSPGLVPNASMPLIRTPVSDARFGRDELPLAAETIYRALVERGPRTAGGLKELLGQPLSDVQAALMLLEGLDLVEWRGGVAAPCPPFPALEAIALHRARDAARAQQLAASLSQLWSQHSGSSTTLEVLQSDRACVAAERALIASALHEVNGLSIGPVGADAERPPPSPVNGFFESIGRGVRYRVVYGMGVVRDATALAAVRACMDAGEQVRVSREVAVNLTIGDRKLALLGVRGGEDRRRDIIVVRPSGLLDVLCEIFDSYWRGGTPLTRDAEPAGGDGPDDDSRHLLTLLAAGLTDEAMARELGVSERTVGRRIARLQERLGAASRFQLGLQAGRHGWL